MALKLVLTIEGDNAAEMANVLNAIAGQPSSNTIALGDQQPKKAKAKEKPETKAFEEPGESETTVVNNTGGAAARSTSDIHLDDVRALASEKIKVNKEAVQALVQGYGVKTVSLIPEAKWPEFMEKLKAI